jgi:hypothetical protein
MAVGRDYVSLIVLGLLLLPIKHEMSEGALNALVEVRPTKFDSLLFSVGLL